MDIEKLRLFIQKYGLPDEALEELEDLIQEALDQMHAEAELQESAEELASELDVADEAVEFEVVGEQLGEIEEEGVIVLDDEEIEDLDDILQEAYDYAFAEDTLQEAIEDLEAELELARDTAEESDILVGELEEIAEEGEDVEDNDLDEGIELLEIYEEEAEMGIACFISPGVPFDGELPDDMEFAGYIEADFLLDYLADVPPGVLVAVPTGGGLYEIWRLKSS